MRPLPLPRAASSSLLLSAAFRRTVGGSGGVSVGVAPGAADLPPGGSRGRRDPVLSRGDLAPRALIFWVGTACLLACCV